MEQIQSLQPLACHRAQYQGTDVLPAEMVGEINHKGLPRRGRKRKEVAKDVPTIYSLGRANEPYLSVITLPTCNIREIPIADTYLPARKPTGQTKRRVGVLAKMFKKLLGRLRGRPT